MAVNYILTQKGNQGNLETLKKFYAQAKSKGEWALRKLSREIVKKSPAVAGKFSAVIGKLPVAGNQFDKYTIRDILVHSLHKLKRN